MSVYKVRLTFQQGSSNKEYNIEVVEIGNSNTYNVNFSYGRIGSTLNCGKKNNTPLSLNEALSEANKLERAKTKKGYKVDSRVDNAATVQQAIQAAAQREAALKAPVPGLDEIVVKPCQQDAITEPDFVVMDSSVHNAVVSEYENNQPPVPEAVFAPQLLNFVTPERAAQIIDEEWTETYFCQLKADGERRPVTCTNGKIEAYNKRGFVVDLNPDFVADISALAGDKGKTLFIDCEDMGSQGLFIFDVLAYDGVDYSQAPFEERANCLKQIAIDADELGLTKLTVLMPVAIDSPQAVLNAVESSASNQEEGIVLRRGSSIYTAGRPNKEGDALKIKNLNTASVIVLEKTPNKRSVKIGLYNANKQLVDVGKVTIPANHDVPISGRIVEVQYLYVNGQNGALFQPVYKGDRSHELEHKECHTGQLVYKKTSDAA